MRYYLLLLTLIAIMYGCHTKTKEGSITLDVSKQESLPAEELFESARIIPLETNDSSLIAIIRKLIRHEEKIYILDRKLNMVMVFREDGKFLFRIDDIGRGPEEYNLAYDININPYTKQLDLLDGMGQFLTFDPYGNFIKKYKLPKECLSYHAFTYTDSENLAFYTSYKIDMYSQKEKKLTGSYFPGDEKYDIGPVSLYTFHDTVYFARPLFDQVYYLKGDESGVAYEWYIPGYDYNPVKDIPDYDRNSFQEFKKMTDNLPYMFFKNFQNERYLYSLFQLYGNEYGTNVFYEKPTGKTYVFSHLKGDIPFAVEYIDDESCINIVQHNDIEKLKKLTILDTQSKTLLDEYDDEDNLYLIEYKFKKMN